jgi:glutamate synthase domain-containing protein 1
MKRSVKLEKQGLYDPWYEHDSCGVGVVADIGGARSHRILRDALEVLVNLGHRGAQGADPKTGDGAGLLIQMPHRFFARECARLGINLPPPGQYGVGMVFFPQDPAQRDVCRRIFEETTREEGQLFLGWRDVPVDPSGIGTHAREVQPYIQQAFVGRGPGTLDEAQLGRKLYVIRRRVEKAIAGSGIADAATFYVSSLFTTRIIYKGLLMAHQLSGFYRDLADPDIESAFALVHSRFSTNTLGSWKLAHPYRLVAHNGEINTLRGNLTWMAARQSMFSSPLFGGDLEKLLPIITPGRVRPRSPSPMALSLAIPKSRSLRTGAPFGSLVMITLSGLRSRWTTPAWTTPWSCCWPPAGRCPTA